MLPKYMSKDENDTHGGTKQFSSGQGHPTEGPSVLAKFVLTCHVSTLCAKPTIRSGEAVAFIWEGDNAHGDSSLTQTLFELSSGYFIDVVESLTTWMCGKQSYWTEAPIKWLAVS